MASDLPMRTFSVIPCGQSVDTYRYRRFLHLKMEDSQQSGVYNPQNEKIVFCKTKRTIPQNEAYPEKSFFDAVEYNKSTLKVAFVSLHDICDTQAATSLVVGSV